MFEFYNAMLFAFLQLTKIVTCYNERFYVTRIILADNDVSDGSNTPVWFRLGGNDNIFTQWFSSSELNIPGTGYDLSRYLDDIGMVPETLTIVKLDDDNVKIEEVAVDFYNYTFPSPRSLRVSEDNIKSLGCCSCDIVTINFITQSHKNEYYWNDCPYKQLKPWTLQNNTKSYNGTNIRSTLLHSNISVNASVNASIDAPVYVSYSDYLRANLSVNKTLRAMNERKGNRLRLFNATTDSIGIDDDINNEYNGNAKDISIPTLLPAPAGSTIDSTIFPILTANKSIRKRVESVDSLPPPLESTLYSNGLVQ